MNYNTAIVTSIVAILLALVVPVMFFAYQDGQIVRACIHEHGRMVNNACEFPRR